jgi:hypothetical protein
VATGNLTVTKGDIDASEGDITAKGAVTAGTDLRCNGQLVVSKTATGKEGAQIVLAAADNKIKITGEATKTFNIDTTSGAYLGSSGTGQNLRFFHKVGSTSVGMCFTSTGDLRVEKDVVAYASSDQSLKDNLTPITNALDKTLTLTGYEFDWNDKQQTHTGHDVGVVAQEVEQVLPEVVATREDGTKAVKYEKIVPLLIESIKELSARVEQLESQLK